MKKIMGMVLTSIGIFGLIFGAFDFQHGSEWGRSFSYSYYYYPDEARILIGACAVILFFGIMLLKRENQVQVKGRQ